MLAVVHWRGGRQHLASVPFPGLVRATLPRIALGIFAFSMGAFAQTSESVREPSFYASILQAKAAGAKRYMWDAVIDVSRKIGESPRETIATFNAKLAVAPERKYLLWVGDKTSVRYLIVSDGTRTWALAPQHNKYVELEAVASSAAANPDWAFVAGLTSAGADPVLCSGLVMPILARLDPRLAPVVDLKMFSDGISPADHRELPWLTVLSGKPGDAVRKLTEVALDLESFRVTNLHWTSSSEMNDEPMFVVLNATFSNFQVDEPLPASYFVFNSEGATRVDELPIPALFGTTSLNQPAPDVEISSASGRNVRLRDLRGRTTLLTFTAPDCPPCKKQSAAITAVREKVKNTNAVLLEAGIENPRLAAAFRVHFFPTTIVIDREGIVRSFLPGVRDEAELSSRLSSPTMQ